MNTIERKKMEDKFIKRLSDAFLEIVSTLKEEKTVMTDKAPIFEEKRSNRKPTVPKRIRDGLEEYGPQFCANNEAADRDKVYKVGFVKFLSKKIGVNSSTISKYMTIRRNAPEELLTAICEGKAYHGLHLNLSTGQTYANKHFPPRKPNVAAVILEGYKKYGHQFCANNDADCDKVYKYARYEGLAKKIKVSPASINHYEFIRENGPEGLLEAICKKEPFNGKAHTLLSGYNLSKSIRNSSDTQKEEPDWLGQASDMLRRIFGVSIQ